MLRGITRVPPAMSPPPHLDAAYVGLEGGAQQLLRGGHGDRGRVASQHFDSVGRGPGFGRWGCRWMSCVRWRARTPAARVGGALTACACTWTCTAQAPTLAPAVRGRVNSNPAREAARYTGTSHDLQRTSLPKKSQGRRCPGSNRLRPTRGRGATPPGWTRHAAPTRCSAVATSASLRGRLGCS